MYLHSLLSYDRFVAIGLDLLCIGHFKMLFRFMNWMAPGNFVQKRLLEVVSLAAANQECVADIAASAVVVPLFVGIIKYPDCKIVTVTPPLYLLFAHRCKPHTSAYTAFVFVGVSIILSLLFTLTSNATIVKESLEFGIL